MIQNQTTDALACGAENRYTVKAGDTFASVAQAYGVTPGELTELNPYVSPNLLIEGQVICVPARAPREEAGGGDQAQTQPAQSPCPEGWEDGTVEPGESYADLLVRYDISYRAMRSANPALLPALLRAGQRFCVPPRDQRRVCPAGMKQYTMAAGETLDSVAEKYRLTRGRLLRLNPTLAPGDFAEGQRICLG